MYNAVCARSIFCITATCFIQLPENITLFWLIPVINCHLEVVINCCWLFNVMIGYLAMFILTAVNIVDTATLFFTWIQLEYVLLFTLNDAWYYVIREIVNPMMMRYRLCTYFMTFVVFFSGSSWLIEHFLHSEEPRMLKCTINEDIASKITVNS